MSANAAYQEAKDWTHYIRRIAEGDESAFLALYDESGPLVFGLALRIIGNPADAEEIAADVYAQVWRQAASFNLEKGNPAAWLTILARSRAIDRYRSKLNQVRRMEKSGVLDDGLPDSSPNSERNSILEQRRKTVRQALNQLKPEQKEAVEMAFFLGYTHSEVAEILGIAVGTAKSRVRTGIQRLRENLEAFEDAV